MLNKRGFIQISFAWLFAIIIGAIILFFAIYGSVRLINTQEDISNAQTGKEIAVLLNPLETGFGEERTTPLSIPVESKIFNECDSLGDFGQQEISISQKTRGEFTATGVGSTFYNKYIFSNKSVEGRNFYLFSKPFEFPFKVSDLIFLTSSQENYCFTDTPKNIEEELIALGQGNLFTTNCPKDSINVCFKGNCDITVKENEKSVNKGEGPVYYETDSLMFGAIFSDKETYECQVQRLMKRLNQLALIYNDKESIISTRGCPAEINMLGLADSASSTMDSSELINVKLASDNVEDENKRAYCALW